eukprot:3593364-Rhodomonas_salina.1
MQRSLSFANAKDTPESPTEAPPPKCVGSSHKDRRRHRKTDRERAGREMEGRQGGERRGKGGAWWSVCFSVWSSGG